MLRRFLSALLGLALVVGAAHAQKDAVKDKATKDEPKDKGMTVKVEAVNATTHMLKVTTDDGKVLMVKIEKDTKIVGPRGGASNQRLKDDRLATGSQITLWLSTDMKTAKVIRLGFRKRTGEKDKKDKN